MKKDTPVIAINSLVYFLLAYFFVIFFTNGFLLLIAVLNGTGGTLSYYGFDLESQAAWTGDLKLLIYFFGTGISLLLGIVFERIYKSRRRRPYPQKIFFLWVYLIAFSYFFGNTLAGAFFYYGPGVVFEMFGIPFLLRILIGIAALILLIYTGIYATRGVLISLNSYYSFIDHQQFRSLIAAQLLYPYLFGMAIIFVLKIPHHADLKFLDTFVLACMIIPLLAAYFHAPRQHSIRFGGKNKNVRLLAAPLVLVFIVIAAYRLGLQNGLTF